jgi:ABC-type branched-subunit amino acid transport system ATPase component
VTLEVRCGARHALIGPNGAGKTTLINLLTGFLAPSEGCILLQGEDITWQPQHKRVRRGLGRTFQVARVFVEMTASERSNPQATKLCRDGGWASWGSSSALSSPVTRSLDVTVALQISRAPGGTDTIRQKGSRSDHARRGVEPIDRVRIPS